MNIMYAGRGNTLNISKSYQYVIQDMINRCENVGEISDGYHTFNELYDHRAALFAALCSYMKKDAWKSKYHEDGTMFDGMFIVGIQTKYGQITYHYDLDKWDWFNVKELDHAPLFDGHNPNTVIRRLIKIAKNN